MFQRGEKEKVCGKHKRRHRSLKYKMDGYIGADSNNMEGKEGGESGRKKELAWPIS